jgi:hydroxymethylbilane synthase
MPLTSKKIRIGSRSSNLAIAQTKEVIKALSHHIPADSIEIIKITTSGDKIQDRNLAEIGGKGLFIKELEEALLQNKIDIAIHSAKDIPPVIDKNTTIAAFTQRFEANDCLISKKFDDIDSLPQGAIVGTSSARRKAILLSLRPDLKIVNFRGNVDTRLNKVNENQVDASILALCGLTRIGKTAEIKEIIPIEKMLPSGGQGALALQVRNDDFEITKLVEKINDSKTQICVKSERAFLRELGASCSSPVAVYACKDDKNLLNLKASILDYNGSETFSVALEEKFDLEKGIELGITAAKTMKKEAKNLLARIIKVNE